MNWSCAVICSLSISWWDHNVSITFVVVCGLPRLARSYGLFSHHCIPQARGMCSVCPKNGTRCSSLRVKTPVLEMVWLSVRDGEMLWGVSLFDRLEIETNVHICENERQTETQIKKKEQVNLSSTPTLSWVAYPLEGPITNWLQSHPA